MKNLFRWEAVVRTLAAFSLIVVIGVPMSALAETQSTLPSPTVLSPKIHDRAIVAKPLFKGVTQNKTRVAVYIDDVYNGDAEVKQHRSGTASWSYEPFLDLKAGAHEVRVRAVDLESKLQSSVSLPVDFEVEAPLPEPKILSTVVNERSTSLRPFIVGVAPAETHLEIFIDGQLNGSTRVESDASGTGSFHYLPFLELETGSHVVMARAIDEHGKRSEPSQAFAFQTKEATVSATETEEETAEEEVTSTDSDVGEETSATSDEGEVLGEVVSEEEEAANDEKKGSEEQSANQTTNAANEDKAGAAATDDDSNNNSTIGWVILGLIVLALLWRGRKTLFGESDRGGLMKDQHRPSNPTQPPLWKSAESKPMSSNGRDHSFKREDSEHHTPPPPPPASSY